MVVAATTVAVVATSVIAAGVGASALWVFEVLAATGVLVGLGVAFGALDRRPEGGRRWRRRASMPAADEHLSAAVADKLSELDPVEHRRLVLGSPWPTVIVGPTGVVVVSVADQASGTALARLAEVALLARGVVDAPPRTEPVNVHGLLVLPDGAPGASGSCEVDTVSLRELDAAIVGGDLVAMSTVDELFARLSGVLVPALRIDAV